MYAEGPWGALLTGLPPDVAELAYKILARFDGKAQLGSIYKKPLAVSSKQRVLAGADSALNWSFDSLGIVYGINVSAGLTAPDALNAASFFIRNDASNENVFATEDNPYDLAGLPNPAPNGGGSLGGAGATFLRMDPTPVHSTNDLSGALTFPTVAAWATDATVAINLIGVYFFLPGSQINS